VLLKMLRGSTTLSPSINIYINNALHTAAAHGHTQVVAELLKAGADPDVVPTRNWACGGKNGGTPLYFAAVGGHVAAAGLLLQVCK
jgi:ankyrin repeat protein